MPEWPGSANSPGRVDRAVFDGEAVADNGKEGVQDVFAQRARAGGAMALMVFDLLQVDGQDVMREPWTGRRERLEDVMLAPLPRVSLVPVTGDALALWDTWEGRGVRGSHLGVAG